MDRGAWWATVHWVTKSWTRLTTHTPIGRHAFETSKKKKGQEGEALWPQLPKAIIPSWHPPSMLKSQQMQGRDFWDFRKLPKGQEEEIVYNSYCILS